MSRVTVGKDWAILTSDVEFAAQVVTPREGEVLRAATLPAATATGKMITIGKAATDTNTVNSGANLYGRVFGGKGDATTTFDI